MFKFFRRKKTNPEDDPTLREILRQNKELETLSDFIRENNESLKREILKKEALLRDRGHTQEDLDRIRTKAHFNVIK